MENDYWSYTYTEGESGKWIRKGMPIIEKHPRKRHPDRKITHIYECVVNSDYPQYFTDHSLKTIVNKSYYLLFTVPVTTTARLLHHVVIKGFKTFFNQKSKQTLCQRVWKWIQKAITIPYYGTMLFYHALALVAKSHFSKDGIYHHRRKIGLLQEWQNETEYFSTIFRPLITQKEFDSLSADQIKTLLNRRIRKIIQSSLVQLNSFNPYGYYTPFYRSTGHQIVLENAKDHEELIRYYSRCYAEVRACYKNDSKVKPTQLGLMNKINLHTKQLKEQLKSIEKVDTIQFIENEISELPFSTSNNYSLVQNFKLFFKKWKYDKNIIRFYVHCLHDCYHTLLLNHLEDYQDQGIENIQEKILDQLTPTFKKKTKTST